MNSLDQFERPDGYVFKYDNFSILEVKEATHSELKKLQYNAEWGWRHYPPLISSEGSAFKNLHRWQLNAVRGLNHIPSLRWDFAQYHVIVDALMSPAFADLSMDAVIRAVLDGDSSLESTPDQHEPE